MEGAGLTSFSLASRQGMVASVHPRCVWTALHGKLLYDDQLPDEVTKSSGLHALIPSVRCHLRLAGRKACSHCRHLHHPVLVWFLSNVSTLPFQQLIAIPNCMIRCIYASTLAYVVDSNVGCSSSAVATNSAFRGFLAFVSAEAAVPLQVCDRSFSASCANRTDPLHTAFNR